MERRPATENLQRVLLEEVIKSHLLANAKTIPDLRNSEDCYCIFHGRLKLDLFSLFFEAQSCLELELNFQEKAVMILGKSAPDTAEAVGGSTYKVKVKRPKEVSCISHTYPTQKNKQLEMRSQG